MTKDAFLATDALATPPGFAAVCGVLLPARESQTAESSSAASPELVMTPTVAGNLKAAALALCQQKPLLLEGPPGAFLHSTFTTECPLY